MDHNRVSNFLQSSGDERPAPATYMAAVPSGLNVPPMAAELYSAAWAQSVRDRELDRLFNAAFYYEI